MRKFLMGVAATALLFFVGVGAAVAVVNGSISVSTNGAYVSGGYYDFKYPGCKWSSTPAAWDGYVSGKFVVTASDDHLNATVDGYSWTKIVQGDSEKSYAFSKCIIARDVIVHDSLSLQACREHWYGDDCSTTTKYR